MPQFAEVWYPTMLQCTRDFSVHSVTNSATPLLNLS